MASTPQPIKKAITVAAVTLYTAFVSGASRAMLVSLDFANTTTADITIDCWVYDDSAAASFYFADDLTVPAKGSANWRGMLTLDGASDLIRAQASATGVDCNGTVVENA